MPVSPIELKNSLPDLDLNSGRQEPSKSPDGFGVSYVYRWLVTWSYRVQWHQREDKLSTHPRMSTLSVVRVGRKSSGGMAILHLSP